MSSLLLDVGNVFIFISGFLLLNRAYRDRNILRGYSLPGTILLMIALTFTILFYVQQGYWVSLVLTVPNYSYWLIVAIYVTKMNRTNKLTRLPESE